MTNGETTFNLANLDQKVGEMAKRIGAWVIEHTPLATRKALAVGAGLLALASCGQTDQPGQSNDPGKSETGNPPIVKADCAPTDRQCVIEYTQTLEPGDPCYAQMGTFSEPDYQLIGTAEIVVNRGKSVIVCPVPESENSSSGSAEATCAPTDDDYDCRIKYNQTLNEGDLCYTNVGTADNPSWELAGEAEISIGTDGNRKVSCFG